MFPAFLRLAWICCIIARHGVPLATRLLVYRWTGNDSQASRCLGGFLAEVCESLGPAFVKVGQLLSTRQDLLPAGMTRGLERLQDQVAPFADPELPQRIQAAFGRPVEELFEVLELEPVASASVAQVHRARLKGSGQFVAVKVRRPGIERRVEEDLGLLRRGARLAALHPAFRNVPLRALIEEVACAIEQQLDFRQEAAHNRRLREIFKDQPQVRVPALIEELCGDDILTMEFIEGLIKLDDTATLAPRTRERVTEIGLEALYRMIFTFGFIHCDLHPGNLFATPAGQVALLDTGFMASLSPCELSHFRTFFWGMVFNDGRTCARVLRETAAGQARYFDAARFESELVELIDRTARMTTAEFQVGWFAVQLFEKQRRLGLHGSPRFTMAILSLLVFEGIAKRQHPTLDFQQAAVPFFSTMTAQRMTH